MPVYNRQSFLTASIESVLSEAHGNFELICVDDGSIDQSEKIIKTFCNNDGRVKYIRQENKGRCIARNNGIKNANADWICFLDSDDIYYPEHLKTFCGLINKF